MGKYADANNLIKKLIVLGDFVTLNLLMLLCLEVDKGFLGLAQGARADVLFIMANAALAVAEVFYSTVIANRHATPEQTLRQTTYLVALQGITFYLVTKAVSEYLHLAIPNFRFTLFSIAVFYIGLMAVRYVERKLITRYRHAHGVGNEVVFVGFDSNAIPLYNHLVAYAPTGYQTGIYYSDTPSPDTPKGLAHKGTLADWERFAANYVDDGQLDEVYCCLPMDNEEAIRRVMRFCNDHVIHFYYIPTGSNMFSHMLKVENIGGVVLFTNCGEPLMEGQNKMLKRGIDIALSLMVCTLLLPLIPILAIIIKLQSPGPVFFCQERTGLNGRNFVCYKFRSMHVNAQADTLQATEKDPRKFAFGDLMRKTNIDELPQFFNVLKGDMSIVGPRPHMVYHTEMYRKLIDKYMIRHFVKPGITGWAQVTGYRGETKELWQMEGRVERDIWYIENWSIWLDIRIIWRTAVQMICGDKKAY